MAAANSRNLSPGIAATVASSCASRRRAEDIAAFLRQEGVKALHYHAGMDATDRSRNQDVFLQEDGVVMTATIAFGMASTSPTSASSATTICEQHRELLSGDRRAGRDGLPADTLTLFSTGDIGLRRRQIEESTASDDQKAGRPAAPQRSGRALRIPRCRRQTLLGYFGETVASACGNCDICAGSVAVMDGTIAAQKAMSAIVRTGERFGTEHLISLLLGEETDAIRNFRHDAFTHVRGRQGA